MKLFTLLFSFCVLLLSGSSLYALPTSELAPLTTVPAPVEDLTPAERSKFQKRLDRLQERINKKVEKRRAKLAKKGKRLSDDTVKWIVVGAVALLLLAVLGLGGVLGNILQLILGIILIVALIVAVLLLLADVI